MKQTQWQAGAAVWQASGLPRLKMRPKIFEKEKRGVGKNVLLAVRTVVHQEQVDTEAGDFNGAAWRRKWCNDQRRDSTIEEAFANTNLPIPDGPTPLWAAGGVPGEWADVCGFIKPPRTETEWHIRVHGAFEINREVLGIKHTDQSCHHEIWIHLLQDNARLVARDLPCNALRDGQDRQRLARIRNNPHHPRRKTRQFTSPQQR